MRETRIVFAARWLTILTPIAALLLTNSIADAAVYDLWVTQSPSLERTMRIGLAPGTCAVVVGTLAFLVSAVFNIPRLLWPSVWSLAGGLVCIGWFKVATF
jgi:hypothetical protein